MDHITLKYQDGLYRYNYKETNNKLLLLTTDLLISEEIRTSDYYKEFIYELPHNTYSGNAYYIDRVENFIIIGFHYSHSRTYLPLIKFESLMIQWRKAYNTKPNEMIISVDKNKNFTITYESKKDKSTTNIKHFPQSSESNDSKPIFSSSKIEEQDNYFEIEPIDDRLFAFPSEDSPTLNLFADLLIGEIPLSDYKEKLAQPPYEYYDDRYYLAIVEDRILIYDKTAGIKALPSYDKFLDLMDKWQIAIKKKSELYRIYIENDYDFKIFILEEIK